MFLRFLTLIWSVAFLYLTSCQSCATLSQVGLFEVLVIYLGSLGYFPTWGPVLPDGRPSKWLMIMGGLVCVAYLVWSCTLSMHTPPLRRYRLIIGGPDSASP
jgi:hypothetical protein